MKAELVRVGDVAIESVDIRALSDAEIQLVNTYSNILRAESNPDLPPTPLELTRANLRNLPPMVEIRSFVARDPDGAIAASAEGVWMAVEENKHLLDVGLTVRPDRRRQGIARALLSLVADVAEAEGRTLLMSSTSERVPAGETFARRVGAEAGLSQHINRLLVSELDRDLVAQWVAEGPGRAPGYSLVSLDGPYPDELVDRIVAIHHVMNTAPRDDLQMEDFNFTVEHMRQWEKSMVASGEQRWSLFVRHDASGELVGFTEVGWNAASPKIVGQWGTGVRPDHRGHALGKWIKAAMLQRVLDERPEAEEIRTGNADSNDAMLGINTQLGFKPYRATIVWQAPLDVVRAYLGSSA